MEEQGALPGRLASGASEALFREGGGKPQGGRLPSFDGGVSSWWI